MVQTQLVAKKVIVSVDPGVNLGLSCLELDLETKQTKVLDAHTCSLNDIAENYYSDRIHCLGLALTRITVIEDLIKDYAAFWQPDFFIHETAFSAHGRKFGGSIESFASLRENILGIKLAACRYDSSIPIISINPNTVKYCVIGEKNNDKDQMKDGIKSKTDLDLSGVNVDKLDQHGVDSIAIGYTFIHKHIYGVQDVKCFKRSPSVKRNKNKTTG